MKKIKQLIVAFALFAGAIAIPLTPLAVGAAPVDDIKGGVEAVGGEEGGGDAELTDGIQTLVNALLFIIGLLAVIMIIFGGFKYVTSGGDAGKLESAKNTILYAVVGLLVAILAFAIVSFVISTFAPKS